MPLPVPPDLEQALAGVPAARRHFDTLPPPAKDRWIGWISRARFGPRRRRRLEHAIATLAAEHGYPVGAQAADTVVVNGHEPLPPEPLVWPWLLAFALLLLIAAGVVWLVAYRHHHHPAGSGSVARAAVPGLVGEPQARAARDVRAHGLQPVTEPRSSAQPKGTIVDQRPAAGTMLRRGSPVTLFVSQGEPKVSVPKVTGLPAAAAVTKLENAKLVAKILDVPSTKTPGIVVAEKPKPAAKAPQGSTVVLAVAKGGGKVNVPAVVGEKAPQAVSDLVHAGLQATTQPVASDLPRGTVVSQQPAGGERVQKGSSVALKLSKGAPSAAPTATTPAPTTHQAATHPTTTRAAAPQQPTTKPQTTTPQPASQIDVPHLADAGLGTALHALESAGLRATVSYQTSQQPLGQVLSQNPAADAKVAPRTRVQLIVSEGPNPGSPTQLPDVTGEDQATAQTDLENAGFQVIVVRRTGTGQESGTVVEEAPGAGTSLGQNDFVAIYVAA